MGPDSSSLSCGTGARFGVCIPLRLFGAKTPRRNQRFVRQPSANGSAYGLAVSSVRWFADQPLAGEDYPGWS